jgi:hypothetical protein
MAHYRVTAKPKSGHQPIFRVICASNAYASTRPFGKTMNTDDVSVIVASYESRHPKAIA